MGNIGDEIRPLALHLLQGIGHGVESLGQGADLVSPLLIAGDPDVKLPLAEFSGSFSHLVQGPGLVGGGEGAGDDGDQKHHHGGEEKDGGGGGPHGVQVGGTGRHQHHPLGNGHGADLIGDGQGGQIPLFRVEPPHVGHAVEGTLVEHLGGHVLREDAVLVVVELAVGGGV